MHETTTARLDLGGQVWHFTRHWLEMCVVMCVVSGILNGLAFLAGPALLGYPDLRQRSPALAVLVGGVIYVLPMAVWMRFRGMAWRRTVEMSGAVMALAIAMIGAAWAGVVSGAACAGGRWASAARRAGSCSSSCCCVSISTPDEPAT
ncbi:MAG TPA: hypothetical protein VGQ26_01770 [Streptosporangiaceae bacterium]|nr:hypothetical protein [Streptosporangiaceae bacterium]